MSEVSLVVLIEVQDGKGDEQVAAFANLAPVVRAEEGCLEYNLFQVRDAKNQFALLEKWASDAAHAAHLATPHMLEAAKRNPAFRAGAATVLKLAPV